MIKNYLEEMTKLSRSIRNPKLRFRSFEEFILKNGKEFKSISFTKVKRGRMKQCYMNAFHLADRDYKYIYAEGFATSKRLGLPVLHAWCVTKDGKVVDPTWKDGDEYWGVEFDLDYVRKTILKKRTFGVLDNWENGFPLLSGEDTNFRVV